MRSQEDLVESFASLVFTDVEMHRRLSQEAYAALRRTVDEGEPLDLATADAIAEAMKNWALERGATHYTHWFQPLSGQSAEKQDAFLMPHRGGKALLEFSGKALISGETDASSFPSGGLRATFEARGYTTWDCTAPAFVREDPGGIVALCIPTAFCAYTGEALDTRTPLLRAGEALCRQGIRVLRALGDKKAGQVFANVGLEQEYFLIDRELYRKRRDIIYTGRSLVGAKPPKGQEMDDQYYAAIRQRVSGFMAELNQELWKLGIPAKTQHNEAAPAQHEVAVVFDQAVAACDQNQLTMMLIKKVAAKRGMHALLHEKPFDCVSGSGKHNNWSLATDTGENLFDPGPHPGENVRFQLFFAAVLAAVDTHAGLLRSACATAANDHRLGGHEAPIALISVFIGEELERLFESLVSEGGHIYSPNGRVRDMGIKSLPQVTTDNTDRNRTSPLAFTGNKFEFRMPGASQSAATVNAFLNAAMADQLQAIAHRLEGAVDPMAEAKAIAAEYFARHRRVVFNGNNYAQAWQDEAIARGLPHFPTAVEAIEQLTVPASVDMFERQGVFTRVELDSRATMRRDAYIKTLRIEASTLLELLRRQVLPAAMGWQATLAGQVNALAAAGIPESPQRGLLARVTSHLMTLSRGTDDLERTLSALEIVPDQPHMCIWRDEILPLMRTVRRESDALEVLMPREVWPLPTIGELLYHV